VLVRNLKRDDRKGGWHYWQNIPLTGPHIIESLDTSINCVLKSGSKI